MEHQPEAYRTKQGIVQSRLRQAILDGEYEPGEWLRLRDISAEFGTSTMPIREALQALASEGLVHPYPHRGAQVAPLTAEEFEEIYMARLGVEGLAARLGAAAISESDVARMRELETEMAVARDAHDPQAWLDTDLEFHAIHYRASNRPRLVARIDSLRRQGHRYMRLARISMADEGYTESFHRRVIDACARHDGPVAERLVRDDLEFTVERLGGRLFPPEAPQLAAPERQPTGAVSGRA